MGANCLYTPVDRGRWNIRAPPYVSVNPVLDTVVAADRKQRAFRCSISEVSVAHHKSAGSMNQPSLPSGVCQMPFVGFTHKLPTEIVPDVRASGASSLFQALPCGVLQGKRWCSAAGTRGRGVPR